MNDMKLAIFLEITYFATNIKTEKNTDAVIA